MVVPIVFSLIFILSFIGNGCIIHAVLRYKSMRTAPNLFIGELTIIIVCLPSTWHGGAYLYHKLSDQMFTLCRYDDT